MSNYFKKCSSVNHVQEVEIIWLPLLLYTCIILQEIICHFFFKLLFLPFSENHNWLWILYLFCLIFVLGKLFLHARAPSLQFLAVSFLSHSEFPTFSCPPMCHRHPMLQVAHSFQETHSSGFLQENLFVNEFTQEWLQPSKRTPKLSIFQSQHLPAYLQNNILLSLSRPLCF